MGKRTYRAIGVKKINLPDLLERAGNSRVIVGIDVAKEDFYAALMIESGEVLVTIKWKHPLEAMDFINFLQELQASRSVEVALEPTGTYGDVLMEHVRQLGLPIYRLSPKRVHDAAEVFDGVPSQHDPKCAMIVARLHRDGVSRPWPAPEGHQRSLRAQAKIVDLYAGSYQRNVCRLESVLARYWPELESLLKLGSTTMLELLMQIGCAQEVAKHPEQTRAVMKRAGKSALSAEKITQVIQSAQNNLGIVPLRQELIYLQELASETRRNQLAMNTAKRVLRHLTRNDEEIMHVAKAVGHVTAAMIYSEVGSAQNYLSAASYEKSIGLNLKVKSSGKSQIGRLKITKRGSGKCRKYLYMAALRLIYRDPIARTWFAKKVARDGGKKMRAVIALMRKLTKALWHVAQGNKFNTALMFDTRRLKLSASIKSS